jgi:hypothetical protein
MTNTPTHKIWQGVRKRCLQKTAHNYHRYGGRGIQLCARWNDFLNFLADMGERPDGMTIERLDNNGDYEPGNCRWSTHAEQASNRRNNIFINGETISNFCRRLGLKMKSFHHYYRIVNLPLEEAVSKASTLANPRPKGRLKGERIINGRVVLSN